MDGIERIRTHNYKACIFGAGEFGREYGYNYVKRMGINIDFFSDNNPETWGKEVREGLMCYAPNHIRRLRDVVVFVMIYNTESQESVVKQLKTMGIREVIGFNDLYLSDEYIKGVFDFGMDVKEQTIEEEKAPFFTADPIINTNSKQVAIYTCITGNYDNLEMPEFIEDEVADYYVITEDMPTINSVYRFLGTNDIIPHTVGDNVRRNRFCKILGCDIFKNYPYCIYVDGKLRITGEICRHIKRLNSSGIALRMEEPPFDCLYQEGAWALDKFVNDEETIKKQMRKYYYEGMPFHWGCFECSCIVRDNHNERLNNVMHDWWSEVYNYSFRDQLSFTYALWKNNYRFSDIGIMEGTLNNDKDLLMIDTHGR